MPPRLRPSATNTVSRAKTKRSPTTSTESAARPSLLLSLRSAGSVPDPPHRNPQLCATRCRSSPGENPSRYGTYRSIAATRELVRQGGDDQDSSHSCDTCDRCEVSDPEGDHLSILTAKFSS